MSTEMKSSNLLNTRRKFKACTKRGLALFKVTGSQFQCLACGEHFAGPRAFGHHRVDAECLSPEAMRERGMSVTPTDFWTAQWPQEVTA